MVGIVFFLFYMIDGKNARRKIIFKYLNDKKRYIVFFQALCYNKQINEEIEGEDVAWRDSLERMVFEALQEKN